MFGLVTSPHPKPVKRLTAEPDDEIDVEIRSECSYSGNEDIAQLWYIMVILNQHGSEYRGVLYQYSKTCYKSENCNTDEVKITARKYLVNIRSLGLLNSIINGNVKKRDKNSERSDTVEYKL
ncbi:hypothetical protein J6590_026411 [Homalodisca vitripennis]|nr:hypothetical protein J6590_026411 [Homalodisca vitripennis]